MVGYSVGYCANGFECKNVTANGADKPTRVRKGHSTCSYCTKGDTAFKKLKSAPKLSKNEGEERRGRKPLDLDDNEKRERNLAQRAIAQAKLKQKKLLLAELGSKSHPEYKKRWQEISNDFELRKKVKWGKVTTVELKKDACGRKIIEKGTTENGWSWRVFNNSLSADLFDIDLQKIDALTGAKSEPHSMNGLTAKAYKAAIDQLEIDGIDNLKVTHPFSSYSVKAKEFKTQFMGGELTIKDKENLRNRLTFGFAVALLLHDKTISKTNMPTLRTIYRVIGDAPIPFDAGRLQTAVDDWMKNIAEVRLARSTRVGAKGGAKTVSSLNILFNRLSLVLKNLEKYKSVLATDGVHAFMVSRMRHWKKHALNTGAAVYGNGYRCLRQAEICEIFKATPTVKHAAMIALSLSTGLRPDELAKLTTEYFNKESGSLHYRGGKLLSAKLAAYDPKYLANPFTSTVVKLILSNKEFFDVEGRDAAVLWMQKQTVVGKIKSMKGSTTLARIAKWTGKPIATMRDFRTTAATMLRFTGVPMDEIQQRLGHVSNVTTASTYVKISPDDGEAYSHMDALERGKVYFKNPKVQYFDKDKNVHTYVDKNEWDTFILCQFLQAVVDHKKRATKKMLPQSDADKIALDYWQWQVTPMLVNAINMVKTSMEKRATRLPDQTFNPFAGSVSTPDLDIPMPVQLTPSPSTP